MHPSLPALLRKLSFALLQANPNVTEANVIPTQIKPAKNRPCIQKYVRQHKLVALGNHVNTNSLLDMEGRPDPRLYDENVYKTEPTHPKGSICSVKRMKNKPVELFMNVASP
jgi:hypothetical protein